ncbi:hypothetical protein CMK14_23790 [Candidatus Poribacteria bacterium]|nr:hypothetical protein [Candidatus Poribacteria bacterium]
MAMPEKSLDQTDSVLDSPTPLSDVHLQTTISELEAEIDVAKGRQRDLDETRSRIEKLNLQLQQAKRETEEARNSMDVLRIEEARVRAELEVTKAQRQRAEQETKAIQPVINEFRQGVERTTISLQDARHKLKSAKALRDAEKSEIEKVKQALYAAVALEAQIQAETEAARSSAERDRQQTEEIQSRLQNLREQSEKIRLSADQAQIELQSSRVAESKIQVSEEYLPEERILETDNSQGENIDQVDGLSQELTTSLSRSASRLAMLKEILPENVDLGQDKSELPSRLIKQPKLEAISSPSEPTEIEGLPEENEQASAEDHTLISDETSLPATGHTTAPGKLADATEQIYQLADEGKDVVEISRLANIARGEAELLLRMRNLKFSQ